VNAPWAPLWLKELTIRGTLAYGGHAHAGASAHAFTDAAAMIADGRAPVAGLVTHEYRLQDYRAALHTARAKGQDESVKVAFRF
jgi:threonine dehydrogenase-like Zn-dependent dehydrogenase